MDFIKPFLSYLQNLLKILVIVKERIFVKKQIPMEICTS